MKFSYLCALPVAFAFCFTAVHAADVDVHAGVNIGGHKGHEYRMKTVKRGDHYVGVYNNHEYVLRGDAATRINAEGEYTVYGDISPDDTYIETYESAPVVVEQRRVEPVREREVIVEKREPFIKVGPVKIGD